VAGTAAGMNVDERKVRAQLKKWQERLLDLTKGNPLLGVNRSRVSKLRLTAPDSPTLFETLAIQNAELKMPRAVRESSQREPEATEEDTRRDYRVEPGDVTFDCTPGDLARKLRRIYDNGHTSIEERGVTTLHVTLGTLAWRDGWLGDSVAPLWMVPVHLISKGPNVALRLVVADEELQLNPALELYLRERHKINLPPIPEEPSGDLFNTYLSKITHLVQEHRWTVTSDAWMSTFSFESLVIYKDLEAMADLAVQHPIVAAFARATTNGEASETLGGDLDELGCPEPVPLPLLAADGTQLAALTQAASGAHVVVHGPPGTGKSQTISNLIADALRRNKTVLFVSSKMAALNVVYERLAKFGLGRFCLEAHSTKAGKTKIIDELRRTLETESASDGGRFNEQLEATLHVRNELNRYVQELHCVRDPLGKTVYQAIGRVAVLASAPEIRAPLPWRSLLEAPLSELDQRLDVLNQLAAHAKVFDSRKTHPWRGFAPTGLTIEQREQIEAALQTVLTGTEHVSPLLPPLKGIVSEADQLSLGELSKLSGPLAALSTLERMPRDWFNKTAPELLEMAKLLDTGSRLLSEFQQQHQFYSQTFELPLKDAEQLLEPAIKTFSHWYQRVTASYWRWRSEVKKRAKQNVKVTYKDLAHLYAVVLRLLEIDRWLVQRDAIFAAEVDAPAVRDCSALSRAAERCRSAAAVVKILTAIAKTPASQVEIDEPFRKALCHLQSALPAKGAAFDNSLEVLDQNWPTGFVDASNCRSATVASLTLRLSELLAAINLVQEWVALQRVLQNCDKLGLTAFLNALGSVSAQRAADAFEYRFYTLWASAVLTGSDVLASFDGVQRQALVDKFRTLDAETRKLVALHIQASASMAARRLQTAQSNVDGSEVGVLRRELQKRKRIKALRKLFGEIPRALQALKPCMLMSPISVSTFLKPGIANFDLVVFDEASQLPTAEAIASILRASQVVVAGDRNQLPPTSFFRANFEFQEDEDEDENLAEDPLESLLDDSVAVVPLFREAYLKWHYRSKDERLIKFSNHFFYDNRLVTFPSASTSELGRGLRVEYVAEGMWDRGRSRTNRREADRVAELVVDHFTRYPGRSLGIVAMNLQQKELIEDTIAKAVESRPDILPLMDSTRPEPYFVKSLENVQGDERDTMLISIGYGKDSTGHLSLNFGPLNREGGWRRLNVLVTRAKWQTIVVTSIRSHELSGLSPNNRGPIALRDFINYGERRCELPQAAAAPTLEETNDFEDSIATALRDRGLIVDQQVGASKFRIDLAIRDQRDTSRYVLGVECDGATYHSTRTARDRDILRQHVLESMGWRIHRVWSTDWFNNRAQALDRILESHALAQARPIDETIQAVPLVEIVEVSDPLPGPNTRRPTTQRIQRRFKIGQPYETVGGKWHRDLLLEARHMKELASAIEEIVEAEGPIHDDLLSERLKDRCGVGRAGSNIQANIDKALHYALRYGSLERRRQRDFLWKKDSTLTTFRIPTDDFRRPIDWVHRDEIGLAILFLVEDQFGMNRSHLGRAVGNLFGLDRVPAEATGYITEIADELVEQGQLRDNDGQLHLA
jgi:very-short-patch-repair endonuclease